MGWFLPALSILGMGGQAQASSDASANTAFGQSVLAGQLAVAEGAQKRNNLYMIIAVIVVIGLIVFFAFRR